MNIQNIINLLYRNETLLEKQCRYMQQINIELMRINEVADTLIDLKLERNSNHFKKLFQANLEAMDPIKAWVGIRETIYALNLASHFKEEKNYSNQIDIGLKWVSSCLNPDGGIGRYKGDRSRIPVAWTVVESFKKNGIAFDTILEKLFLWMQQEWAKDLKLSPLSYKVCGILIANHAYPNHFEPSFVDHSLKWLLDNQNNDGGWGPRRSVPINSVPSYTGLALRALLPYVDSDQKEIRNSIEKGLNWILKNQLASGMWDEYPIEKPIIHISLFLCDFFKNHHSALFNKKQK